MSSNSDPIKVRGVCTLLQVFDMPDGADLMLNTAYGMKQLVVRDPDGYDLCFQCEASV
jgi:hypothetical protein